MHIYIHTYIPLLNVWLSLIASMDQPGKVASTARGQLDRENVFSPVTVRADEFGLAGQVRTSRPATACSFSTPLNLVLDPRDSSRFPRRRPFIYTANRHRVSPEFIRSRVCLAMAFIAESPPAQSSIWCPSEGGGTREVGSTVGSALFGGYAPDSAKAEGNSIVDEPGEC